MSRNRISIVVLLAFGGAILAGLLLFDHHHVGSAEATVDQLCGGAEQESGCDQVNDSRYSTVGSFSVAALGVSFYGSMLLLLALGLVSSDSVRDSVSAIALVLFAVALVLDIVLLGVQAFAIDAFCKLCIATYVVNLAALVVLLPVRSKLRSVLVTDDARRALSVWVVGSVVVLAAVASVDKALAAASAPHAPLLGSNDPPPEPASTVEPELPAPVATTSIPAASNGEGSERLEAELQTARARIRELEATLDDPQKFQTYQEEKAAKDFEREKPQQLDLEGIPSKGPADAPIRVVEFSDFLCPFCRNLAGAFGGFMPQSQGRVAIFFKNYPLDQQCNPALTRTVHEGACELALGSICAQEQGKFWPYHDRIFSQPPTNPTNEDVVKIATEAGLDGEALRQCLQSSGARAKLDKDIAEGRRVQVNATPTVFVNGKRLQQIGVFLKAIESEAKRLGLPASSP